MGGLWGDWKLSMCRAGRDPFFLFVMVRIFRWESGQSTDRPIRYLKVYIADAKSDVWKTTHKYIYEHAQSIRLSTVCGRQTCLGLCLKKGLLYLVNVTAYIGSRINLPVKQS